MPRNAPIERAAAARSSWLTSARTTNAFSVPRLPARRDSVGAPWVAARADVEAVMESVVAMGGARYRLAAGSSTNTRQFVRTDAAWVKRLTCARAGKVAPDYFTFATRAGWLLISKTCRR